MVNSAPEANGMRWNTRLFKTTLAMALVSVILPVSLVACAPGAVKHNNRGNSRFAEGEYEQAITEYQLAQVDAPDRAEPYYNASNGLSYNNTLTANVYYGVYMSEVGNMVLRQNNASANTYFGVRVRDSSWVTIENNLISDNNDGIYMELQCSNSTVANNTILDNNNNAVRVDEADDIDILNNTMTGNDYGAYLWYSSNVTIEENYARFLL